MLPVWLADTVTSDLDRALHYTLLWGLEGVELRTVGGPADRVPHVNEAKLRRRLGEGEVLAASVVPGLFEGPAAERVRWLNELTVLKETLAFCGRIGCVRVVVGAFEGAEEEARLSDSEAAADALRRAAEAAGAAGSVLAVHNAPGSAHPTGAALARLLAEVDHPAARAAWDPAAALEAGGSPADGLAALASRVELVRCRDGRLGEGGAWEERPFGEGAVDWPGQVFTLREQGFRGPLSLVVTTEPRPKEGLRAATRLVRLLRDVRRMA